MSTRCVFCVISFIFHSFQYNVLLLLLLLSVFFFDLTVHIFLNIGRKLNGRKKEECRLCVSLRFFFHSSSSFSLLSEKKNVDKLNIYKYK